MNGNGQLLETFTRGIGLGDIGTLVAVTHHAGSTTNGTFYIHNNHRGDVVLTRSGTTTVGTYDYSAFGSLKSQVGNDVCRFKSSSKERDDSTGFSCYGARFDAPQWQRWLSRDPLQEIGGLNLYEYVMNNPVNRIDSLGFLGWSTVGYFAAGVIVGAVVTAALVAAAPAIGAVAVGALMYAGVSSAATAGAIVTGGGALLAAGSLGLAGYNTYKDYQGAKCTGNWNAFAYDIGNITGSLGVFRICRAQNGFDSNIGTFKPDYKRWFPLVKLT